MIVYSVFCGYKDLTTAKIPNYFHLLYVYYLLLDFDIKAIALICITMFCCLPIYYFRLIGAGDIKMFACIVGGCGINNSLIILIIALSLALMYGVYKLIKEKSFLSHLKYIIAYIFSSSIFNERYVAIDYKIRLGFFISLGVIVWSVYEKMSCYI